MKTLKYLGAVLLGGIAIVGFVILADFILPI